MIDFIIKYWLEFVFGIMVGLLTYLIKKIKSLHTKEKAVEHGVQALLRNELIRRYREYETKGEITILDKENVEHLFKEYKNLGGNGTVAQMYEEIIDLPIKIVR